MGLVPATCCGSMSRTPGSCLQCENDVPAYHRLLEGIVCVIHARGLGDARISSPPFYLVSGARTALFFGLSFLNPASSGGGRGGRRGGSGVGWGGVVGDGLERIPTAGLGWGAKFRHCRGAPAAPSSPWAWPCLGESGPSSRPLNPILPAQPQGNCWSAPCLVSQEGPPLLIQAFVLPLI